MRREPPRRPDGGARTGRVVRSGGARGGLVDEAGAGGCPWTVIPVERRDDCMAALEDASVRREIGPPTGFLAGLVRLA